MSLIGVTASGSSPEVIPLRPFQEAATSVASTVFSADRAQPERVEGVHLGRQPGGLGARADYE